MNRKTPYIPSDDCLIEAIREVLGLRPLTQQLEPHETIGRQDRRDATTRFANACPERCYSDVIVGSTWEGRRLKRKGRS